MGKPDLTTSASLQVTPELLNSLTRESTALEEAQVYTIDSAELAEIVNQQLQDVKQRMAAVEKWDEAFAAPIRQLEATRKALFGPAKDALAAAETYFKGLLKGWSEKERLRIADENRKREAEARRLREDAERKAAAERARGAEEARIAREKAEAAEAERKRQTAEAERLRREGDTKAAAEADRKAKAAAAEQAKREEEERQKTAAGERKAQETEMAAAAAAESMPAVEGPKKIVGYSESKNWIAELAPDISEDDAKLHIVLAIAGVAAPQPGARTDLLSLLELDMKAANKRAKADEKHFNVPGLKARNNPIPRSAKGK